MRKGAEGHLLHGSSGPGFDRHQYYIFKDGKMHNGLTVAAYQLTDVREGDGGLCLIPGSHKGNYPCPMALRRGEAYREFIKPIICNAGDCVIFTEATTHGTLPWTADHDRRTALFRFSPGNLAYVPHNWSEDMLALIDRRAAQGSRAALSRTAGTSCIGSVAASDLTKQSRRSSINRNSQQNPLGRPHAQTQNRRHWCLWIRRRSHVTGPKGTLRNRSTGRKNNQSPR